MRMCVLVHAGTSKVRTYLGNEDVLVGPHIFEGLFHGSEFVFKVQVRVGLWLRFG